MNRSDSDINPPTDGLFWLVPRPQGTTTTFCTQSIVMVARQCNLGCEVNIHRRHDMTYESCSWIVWITLECLPSRLSAKLPSSFSSREDVQNMPDT
jgi:hypothetical protein